MKRAAPTSLIRHPRTYGRFVPRPPGATHALVATYPPIATEGPDSGGVHLVVVAVDDPGDTYDGSGARIHVESPVVAWDSLRSGPTVFAGPLPLPDTTAGLVIRDGDAAGMAGIDRVTIDWLEA